MIAFAAENLAGYKKPKSVDFVDRPAEDDRTARSTRRPSGLPTGRAATAWCDAQTPGATSPAPGPAGTSLPAVTETESPAERPSRKRLAIVVAPIVGLIVAAYVGDALTTTLDGPAPDRAV